MVAPLRQASAEKQAANSPPDWNALLGSGSGEPPPDEGASETPEPTDEPTEEPSPEPSPPEMSHPEFKKSQQPQPGFDKPITSDLMSEQLQGQATPEFQKMVAVLERELKASTSPEDFLLRVEALYPELEDDKLIEAFHNGMYAAYLAGLAEAQDEGGDAHSPTFNKKKDCTKGYACGDACISRTRKCRKQANGTPKQEYVEAIGKKKKRTTKKSEKPEPEKTEKQEKPELDKTLGIPDISPVAQRGIDFLGVEFAHRIEQVMQADAELEGLKARFEQAKGLLD